MLVVAHQANYLPYAGFFHKLSMADIFVIQDDVQFDERFSNRNKIISSTGWTWITIPIKHEHKYLPLREVEINNDIKWRRLHWKKITSGYNRTKYFHLYKDELEKIYGKEWISLFEFNFELIKKIISWLGIKIEIVKESELNIKETATERLVKICNLLEADIYLSGSRGKDYLDEELFRKNGIALKYQNYTSLVYPQHLSKSFIQDLSILDLLANMGPDSLSIIKGDKKGKNFVNIQ